MKRTASPGPTKLSESSDPATNSSPHLRRLRRRAYPGAMAKRATEPRTELRRLTTLQEISQVLSSAAELRHALERVLEKLERDHEAVRSAVMVLDPDGREIRIEASVGISAEGRLARYRVGEGITGRVVQSGKPIVVPAISREPLFLNRAVQRKRPGMPELSYVCVPIALNRAPLGALAVDLEFDAGRDYDAAVRFFSVVAGVIRPARPGRRAHVGEGKRP